MKQLLLIIIGLICFGTSLIAQEMPNDVKRYDYTEADTYDGAVYSVLRIHDFVTDEKSYKLKVEFSYKKNGVENDVDLFFSDAVVAEMIKAFNYIIDTQFAPQNKGEKSYIICEFTDGAYFKYQMQSPRIELMVRVSDNYGQEYRELAGIDRDEIEEFKALLSRIEKAFLMKGLDLKNAVISKDNIEPLF